VIVRWAPRAKRDRAGIFDYIAADNPGAAISMDELFDKAAAMLEQHPKIGRPGRLPGTRELLAHKSYWLVYEIDGETIWVLTLVHTARQWPPK
jgi:addiction module RelE/StbE family toxin